MMIIIILIIVAVTVMYNCIEFKKKYEQSKENE